MEVKVGQCYRTKGGWEALVVWICFMNKPMGFYAVHKPQTASESSPIYHWEDGTAHAILSVNEPPLYTASHPADIIMENEQKEKGNEVL